MIPSFARPEVYLRGTPFPWEHPHELYTRLRLEHGARNHAWGYSLPYFISDDVQVWLGVSLGGSAYSSWHFHAGWRQTLHVIKGYLQVQLVDGCRELEGTELHAETLEVEPLEPHRLIFPCPVTFIETYSRQGEAYWPFKEPFPALLYNYKEVEHEAHKKLPLIPITRLDQGGTENFEYTPKTDAGLYTKYLREHDLTESPSHV